MDNNLIMPGGAIVVDNTLMKARAVPWHAGFGHNPTCQLTGRPARAHTRAYGPGHAAPVCFGHVAPVRAQMSVCAVWVARTIVTCIIECRCDDRAVYMSLAA